jgi:hypothetical protein
VIMIFWQWKQNTISHYFTGHVWLLTIIIEENDDSPSTLNGSAPSDKTTKTSWVTWVYPSHWTDVWHLPKWKIHWESQKGNYWYIGGFHKLGSLHLAGLE